MYASSFSVAIIPQLRGKEDLISDTAIMKFNYWYKSVLVQLKPDWTIGVDFCHHVFPSTNGSKVTYFPQGVVLHYIAFSKSCASPTSIERAAFWEEESLMFGHSASTVQCFPMYFSIPSKTVYRQTPRLLSGLRAMLACPLLIKVQPLGLFFTSAETAHSNVCSVLAVWD